MKELDITKYSFFQDDGTHMLNNATNYFSAMVMPAIIELYQQVASGGIQVPPVNPEAVQILQSPLPNLIPPKDRPQDNPEVHMVDDTPTGQKPQLDNAELVVPQTTTSKKGAAASAPTTATATATKGGGSSHSDAKVPDSELDEADRAAADVAEQLENRPHQHKRKRERKSDRFQFKKKDDEF